MYRDRLEENVRDWYYKKPIREATGDSGGGRGSFIGPLVPGVRKFNKTSLEPFTTPVSKYNNAMLEYDSYDGSMDETKKQIKKIEGTAKRITNYLKKHPNLTTSDDDGNVINQTPGRKSKVVPIKEGDTSVTAGIYNGPVELGLKKWKKEHLGPFQEFVDTEFNHKKKQKTLKNNIKKIVGVWEKNSDGTYDMEEHDVHTVNEWVEITESTTMKDLGYSNKDQQLYETLYRRLSKKLKGI
jgi:hypothetical protein